MFQEKGEYYCINGCFQYPIDMQRIKGFLNKVSRRDRVDNIICYGIKPNMFSYEMVMSGNYDANEVNFDDLDNMTLVRLDFDIGHFWGRLLVEPLDSRYYAICILLNGEKNQKEEYEQLAKMFYYIMQPIYGNEGIEQFILTPNKMTKRDYMLFGNSFYIGGLKNNRMFDMLPDISSNTIINEGGVYYQNLLEKDVKKVFYTFLKVLKDS